jgi:sugar phosphate isomerase/epimerase
LVECFEKSWTPPRLDNLLGRIAALRFTFVVLASRLHVRKDRDPGMVRNLFDKHGLVISAFHSDVSSVEGLEETYQYAIALGAPLLTGTLSNKSTEELLDALEKHGDKYDINYGIEPHGKAYSLVDPFQLRGVFDKRSGRVGLCPDTGWFKLEGFDPVDAVELLKDRVYHTHLRCTLEPSGQRVASAEKVLHILKDSDYQGVYSIEHEPNHDPSAELAEARQWILDTLTS